MAPASRRPLALLGAAGLLLAGFLVWYICPYAAGPDSSGYLNAARLLREGRLSEPLRVPPGLAAGELGAGALLPAGYRLAPDPARMVPTYPVGLPLHLAAVSVFVGLEQSAVPVNLAATLALGALGFAVGRSFGARPGWAAAVALGLALSPLTLFHALQPMSDVLGTTWTLAAIGCARRARDGGTGWSLATGAALALAVLVRPTNVLLLVPLALVLPPRLRAWSLLAAGGLPGAAFLLWYNQALYGTALTTGYGDVSSRFALAHVPATLAHYGRWLPVVATPLVFAALALPWARGVAGREKVALAAWAAAFLLPYAAYLHTHESWWYLRFVLPALPALAIAAALVLQEIRLFDPAAGRARARLLSAAALVFAAGWLAAWGWRFQVHKTEWHERGYRDAARWVDAQPPGTIVFAGQVTGALTFYTAKPSLVWDAFTPDRFARIEALARAQDLPVVAVLFSHEARDAFPAHLPGHWEPAGKSRDITFYRFATEP